jgi:hypothetical protein
MTFCLELRRNYLQYQQLKLLTLSDKVQIVKPHEGRGVHYPSTFAITLGYSESLLELILLLMIFHWVGEAMYEDLVVYEIPLQRFGGQGHGRHAFLHGHVRP